MDATTLLIVGAGMSAYLGIPTTTKINDILKILLDVEHADNPRPINERLSEASDIGMGFDEYAKADLKSTLAILLDGDGALNIKSAIKSQDEEISAYLDMYKQHITDVRFPALQHHLRHLTQTYDLLALKSIIYSLRYQTPDIDIVDILTGIQSSIYDGISIPTREIFPQEKDETQISYYCDRSRLEGALNAYKLLIYKLIKHILRRLNTTELSKYEDFYYQLACKYVSMDKLDNVAESWKRENYLSNLGYLTYNWDPLLPFLSMKANYRVNHELLKQSGDGTCKKIYADFGVPFAGIKLSGEHLDSSVYSFSEAAAFLINAFTTDCYASDGKYADIKCKLLIKIIKQFVPHGLLNIRNCPRCQNGFFIFPDNIGKFHFRDIAHLFATDPIPSEYDMHFVASGQYAAVLRKYALGIPDELDCPSCGHPVHFRHSFLEVQSILKNDKPAAVKKIQFDYADFISKADHIVSIGYSFPKDDILNSVFIKNMRIRKDDLGLRCKLTVIGNNRRYADRGWLKVDDFDPCNDRELKQTIDIVTRLFNKNDIRLNFCGFPRILDEVTLDEILTWRAP